MKTTKKVTTNDFLVFHVKSDFWMLGKERVKKKK